MRYLLILCCFALLLPACKDSKKGKNGGDGGKCEVLFGIPNARTGLTSEQCQPVCTCGGMDWKAPTYTEADLERFENATLQTDVKTFYDLDDAFYAPKPNNDYDPYEVQDEYIGTYPDTAVCGIQFDGAGGYTLKTYKDDASAQADGAQITHYRACGFCSTLQDLATYIRHTDLTNPVRQCGIDNFGDKQGQWDCIKDLGFTDACTDIWYYDMEHTKFNCLGQCLPLLKADNQLPDGTLNACVQCDEDISGPLFKTLSGRTRRNAGLASTLCRPCETVKPVDHHYDWSGGTN